MSTELPPDDPPGQGIRKPGAWPVPRSFEETEPDRRYTAAQARFHVVRAALRRWIAAATQIADEVAKAMKESGK